MVPFIFSDDIFIEDLRFIMTPRKRLLLLLDRVVRKDIANGNIIQFTVGNMIYDAMLEFDLNKKSMWISGKNIYDVINKEFNIGQQGVFNEVTSIINIIAPDLVEYEFGGITNFFYNEDDDDE